MVGVYVSLLAVPAFLPLPQGAAHIWTNLTLFAQFVFWGMWWPFVLVSMVLVGRLWCGLLCPEGALSERVSEHGRGGAMPHWLQWKGWPFLAFVLTTIYGQMTSVYQYPGPALIVLGGSTVAAIGVGYLWGRNKRVWCRFLCPVTGVFNLLAKLAPLHFRVDRQAWAALDKPHGAHPADHELRAAGGGADHARRRRLPHVRALQRFSRRGGAGAAVAQSRDRPCRGRHDRTLGKAR